jgi:hypothetical protein
VSETKYRVDTMPTGDLMALEDFLNSLSREGWDIFVLTVEAGTALIVSRRARKWWDR